MSDGQRSGRSSGRVSCKSTELKRCSMIEMRWNKYEVSLASHYYYYYYYYIVSWAHPRPKRHHGCFSRFAALTRVPSRHTDRLRNGHWAQCWRCGLITTKASVQYRRRLRGATVADADELAESRDASLNVVWMEECYTQVTVTWFRSLSTPVDFCHAPSSK